MFSFSYVLNISYKPLQYTNSNKYITAIHVFADLFLFNETKSITCLTQVQNVIVIT